MNESTKTKKALRGSLFALFLCIILLIGTTFAWFTDTASTGVNKIQAGNLDIELQYATAWDNQGNVTKWADAEGKTLPFLVEGKIPAADTQILWEPGCTYYVPEVRVLNKGNLAVKFEYVPEALGVTGNLAEVLEPVFQTPTDTNGDDINIEPEILKPGEASPAWSFGYHMSETAGNEYQNETATGMYLTVVATQATYEKDSFDDQYDKNAEYKNNETIAAGKTFSSGKHTLDSGIIATDPNAIAVKATGSDTNVIITAGRFDGGSGGNNQCIHVRDGATVTIKGGTFTVGSDADGNGNSVIESNGGNIIIEGGFFQTDYSWRGFYYVLNQQNNNPGTITVKGGTFVNYDPSKGDDNLGGNFVADGYKVVSETHGSDTWYKVVKR